MFVWRTSVEAFHVDCLVPTIKHGGGSVMKWGAISWVGLGSLVVLRERVTGEHYCSILTDHLQPILHTVFPGELPLFQDDNDPVHTARWVQTWLDKHNDQVEHFTKYPQSPDFNIIEPF